MEIKFKIQEFFSFFSKGRSAVLLQRRNKKGLVARIVVGRA